MAVVADEAYNTDTLRDHWRTQGIGVCVPSKCNRLVQHVYNEARLTGRVSIGLRCTLGPLEDIASSVMQTT